MARPQPTPLVNTLLAIGAVIGALVFAKEILLPLALAILLSFVLTPIASRIERLGVGRLASVAAVVLFSMALLGGMTWIVATQLVDLGQKLPDWKQNIVTKIESLAPNSVAFSRFTGTIAELNKELLGERPAKKDGATAANDKTAEKKPAAMPQDKTALEKQDDVAPPVAVKVVEMPPSPLTAIQDWLGPLVTPLTTVGMVTVLVVFMLIQREDQRNRLIRLFGAGNLHTTTEVIQEVSERISRYLLMQFLINAGYGTLVALALWLIGVPSAITWGVMSFALRFLPYVGPWIAAAMPVAISFAISTGWTQPLLVIGCFVVLELIAGNVVEPYLYGHSIGVSGLGVILAAIFWTWLWGPIGLVLAVPLTVCLVVTAQYIPQMRFISVLIGDQPTLSAEERIYQRLLAYDEIEPRNLAKHFLATGTLEQFYDNVLLPVLKLAERDRHEEALNDDQAEFVEDAVEDLVNELGAKRLVSQPNTTDSAADDGNLPTARILCIPLRNQADRTSVLMLSQLISADGIQFEIGSADSLTTEIVDQVAEQHIDAVIVAAVPPIGPRQTRLLRQRLRSRYPSLPIVVGIWKSGEGQTAQHLELDGRSYFASTLREAIRAAKMAAAQAGPSGVNQPAI